MKNRTVLALCGLVLLSALLGGCATNRGVVTVTAPQKTVAAQTSGKSVFLRSVTDSRIFEERPKRPEIPSLGFGGAGKAADDIRKRAIGRKRNSFGKALGDILLDENSSVELLVADTLRNSFHELGYTVVADERDIRDETLVIDTDIRKFWAWMNPGFWAITLSCEIETVMVAAKGGGEPVRIAVRAQDHFQTGMESNWMEVINQALQEYKDRVQARY